MNIIPESSLQSCRELQITGMLIPLKMFGSDSLDDETNTEVFNPYSQLHRQWH
jgi:hypothetical protein